MPSYTSFYRPQIVERRAFLALGFTHGLAPLIDAGCASAASADLEVENFGVAPCESRPPGVVLIDNTGRV
jgi:hypothetical protein